MEPGTITINNSKVVHETIDGEVIIMNLETGNYYSLVNVGVGIWAAIERGVPMSNLIEEMVWQYDANREDIEKAVSELIGEMLHEDLISIEKGSEVESTDISSRPLQSKARLEKLSFHIPVLGKHTNMADLLLLDPIHEVDEVKGWPEKKTGWPSRKNE
jgi:hypothetical protein